MHLHAHLRAQRVSCQLWPSPQSRFINDMLMIHTAQILKGLSRRSIKKNSLPVKGKQQKRVISSPEQKSPPGYQHAGEASPWLRCRLTGGGETCKTMIALFLVICRCILGGPAFYISPSVTVSLPGWLCLPVLVSAAVPG